MPPTANRGGQPAIALVTANSRPGLNPSPMRQPMAPSPSTHGQPLAPSTSSLSQANSSSSGAASSAPSNVAGPRSAPPPSLSVSKTWQQCNLTTTLLCTIVMMVLGFLLFKPQTLATKIALWTSKKDYQEYCKTIKQTGSAVSRECLEVLEKGLPPPPSSKLLTRNLTTTPPNIEQPAALWETWNSAIVRGLSLMPAILTISLAILLLYLRRRKKAVYTADMDIGVSFLHHGRQRLSNNGPTWLDSVAQFAMPGLMRTNIKAPFQEMGWTSTIEIDNEPGTVTSRQRRALLELRTLTKKHQAHFPPQIRR